MLIRVGEMHVSISLILQVVRWVLCTLVVYAALFLHEDEEEKIQNLLETLWVRVMSTKGVALSRAVRFTRGIAVLTGRVFDLSFGQQLWSFRSINASVSFSFASMLFVGAVADHLPHAQRVAVSSVTLALWALCFMILGVLPIVVGRFVVLLIWVVLVARFVPAMGMILSLTYKLWGYGSPLRFVATILIILTSSVGFDILYIVLTRWMLRRASEMTRIYEMVGVIIVDCLLGLALVYVPIKILGVTPVRFAWFGIGMALVAASNFLDIVACSIFLILMVFMLAHRLLWPLMERPLYACKRFGIIRRKKLLWTLAVILMFGPKGFSLLKAFLEKVG